MSLTKAIQRTMYSSMKLLKYWLRMRRPGPMKAVSWRCNSLLVMCAIYGESPSGPVKCLKCLCILDVSAFWKHAYHQLAGDLRDGHAKGEQVQAAVVLKQEAG